MIRVSHALQELNINNFNLIGNPKSEQEFNNNFIKITESDLNGNIISQSTNPNDFGVTWSEVKEKINQLKSNQPLELLREERNKKLKDTDWWASSDLTMTDEQISYRQALRDITIHYSSLDNVKWPNKPE
jgi:hypothetical protein|tara:strand:- start:10 stop:399 length:390 start_codon:yes stop_codon:yes gene_type:complete